MAETINVYLLRHGEITHTGSLAGHTDFELTDLGLSQMHQSISSLSFDYCISSPLQRCHIFAEQTATARQLALEVCDEIKEMNFGAWDGKSYEHLWQQPKPNIGDFWHKPFEHAPPEGESFSAFYQRVTNWWQSFLNNQALQDTLVVTHAGVIKCLLAHLLAVENDQNQIEKIASQISVSYGQIIKISVFKQDGKMPYTQIKL